MNKDKVPNLGKIQLAVYALYLATNADPKSIVDALTGICWNQQTGAKIKQTIRD